MDWNGVHKIVELQERGEKGESTKRWSCERRGDCRVKRRERKVDDRKMLDDDAVTVIIIAAASVATKFSANIIKCYVWSKENQQVETVTTEINAT